MKAGKLPSELLSELLDRVEIKDSRVVLGPTLGEDAALIDMGDRYLVAKTDPITFTTDLIGWYLVQVNSNDLFVMGATPRWLMATILLPEHTNIKAVEAIFSQLQQACDQYGITLIGGHTEITYELPRTLAIGAMLGEVNKKDVVLTSGAQPGDAIVLTRGIAIEGAAILAREASNTLRDQGVALEVIDQASNLLFDPGISVSIDTTIARSAVQLHSMHDPTEGGLVTALRELAEAAEVGIILNREKVPVLPECDSICSALKLDPLGLIASGALIATVSPKDAPKLIEAFHQEGVVACVIGYITEANEGLVLIDNHKIQPLPSFERDELARFFSS